MRVPLLPLLLIGALAAPTVVLATGFGGDSPPTRIPVPARVFSAVVEDLSGTSVEITRVSFNGEVYLYGLVGEGQVSVPFEKISTVRVELMQDEGKRVALATLTTGETVRLVVESDLPWYGDAVFGHYKIDVAKVRKITFKGAQ